MIDHNSAVKLIHDKVEELFSCSIETLKNDGTPDTAIMDILTSVILYSTRNLILRTAKLSHARMEQLELEIHADIQKYVDKYI